MQKSRIKEGHDLVASGPCLSRIGPNIVSSPSNSVYIYNEIEIRVIEHGKVG